MGDGIVIDPALTLSSCFSLTESWIGGLEDEAYVVGQAVEEPHCPRHDSCILS